MAYPPFWLWIVAIVLILLGLLPSFVRWINRLPTWACVLIVGAALFTLYLVGAYEFAHTTIQL